MKRYLPFLIPVIAFLLIKLTALGVRFSDTNIYFYTAYQVLQGKLLYKDIFFTNFPLFIYISSIYHLLSGGNIYFYYFTAALESIGTAFLIYLLTLKESKKVLIATVCSAAYLFSYLVLATSDHQTGVFLASFFATLSYYFYSKKHYFFTGALVACAILTKAYFLPVFIAYLFVLPLRPISLKTPVLRFFLGLGVTTVLILSPTLFGSFPSFYKDIVTYSLIRPQGVSKMLIFNALLTREFFLLSLSALSLFFIKKHRFVAVLSLCMITLFIFYKDFYFYYFNIIAPFLCIFFASLYLEVEKRFKPQLFIIPTIILVLISINIFQYFITARFQTITNFKEVVEQVNKLNPPVIYGTNDIAPLLAYQTDTPLLNNIVDTNPTIFRKGFLSSKTLTKDALSQKALLVGHGINYPQYGVRQDLFDEIFDPTLLKSCSLVADIPITTEGYVNRLQFVSCK